MNFLNRRKSNKFQPYPPLNQMGGSIYEVTDPLLLLRLAASACYFGEPLYYARKPQQPRPLPQPRDPRWLLSGREVAYLRDTLNAIDPQDWRYLTPAEVLEQAVDNAVEEDLEWTLREAIWLRQEEHIRVTPQMILVRAANHQYARGSGLIRQYAPWVIVNADEPAIGLAYQFAQFGKPVPNALKKAWKIALEGFDNYELASHRLEGYGVKTVDVVNLVHAKSAVLSRLVHGNLRATDMTWEAIISKQGSTRDAWLTALEVMDRPALLRNLRKIVQAGVKSDRFLEQLGADASVETETGESKQLPFRYYSAYRAVHALQDDAPSEVLDVVKEGLIESMGMLPRFRGRVMALVDNSSSSRKSIRTSIGKMPLATVSNLTGVLAAMRADAGYVGVFGERLKTFRVRKRSSPLDQLGRAERRRKRIGADTQHGMWLFWEQAINNKEHWDTIFVFSDVQAGHGSLLGGDADAFRPYVWRQAGAKAYVDVPQLIATYRAQVNPGVMVYLVQVAGYKGTIMPEFYERTYMLGGWGVGLLRFASDIAALYPE